MHSQAAASLRAGGKVQLAVWEGMAQRAIHSIEIRSKQHKHLILIELRHADALICLHCHILIER